MCLIWISLHLCFISAIVNANNAPVCSPDLAQVDVAEDEGAAYLITTPTCTDSDPGVEGQLSFAFVSGNDDGKFDINPTSGDVTLLTSLDFETTQLYTLVVRVSDGGSPPLEDAFSVYVHVTPINEFTPVFANPNPTINNFKEDSLGVVVTSLQATDGDWGEDGVLRYSITAGDDDNQFHVDHITGELYVVKALDYETKRSHSVTVQVVDLSKTTPKSATTTVKINLQNVNEFYPVCQSFFSVKLPENSPHNKVDGDLVRVGDTCSDLDYDGVVNPQFNFYNRFFNDYAKFFIHPLGIYRTRNPIDPDTEKSLFLQKVTVRERSPRNPRLLTDIFMLIEFVGVDDNPTVWDDTDIQIAVSESTKTGEFIYQLTATDDDPPDRVEGRVLYGIDGQTNAGQFFVTDNGEIYLLTPLDREVDAVLVLDVYAYTANDPTNLVRATVTIQVLDVNDNTPQFSQPSYTAVVTEGDDYSVTPVTTVTASDPDLASSGTVTFSISDGDPDGDFNINPNSGEVTAPIPLDYEKHQRYSLTILATDGGPSPLSSTALLVVNVLPVNEFDPVAHGTLDVSISEWETSGFVIGSLNASDADSGPDGVLIFSPLNDIYPFSVNPATGAITLISSDLDRENVPVHNLEILISDSSETVVRSASTTVTISLLDENDSPPVCQSVIYAEISVTDLGGTEVTSLLCTDADIGTNADLKYTIISGNDLGEMNVDANGKIVLSKPPSIDHYRLKILVEDKGAIPLSATVDVIVNAFLRPTALNLPEVVEFPENIIVGVIVFQVNSSLPGTVDYVISSGNDKGYFIIGRTSGVVYLARNFDKELLDRFELTIDVSDVRSGFVTQGNLTVLVNDVNDNSPKLDTEFSVRKVSENLALGTEIITFSVSDADVDAENRQITFSFESGNEDNTFGIDASGKLTSTGVLDYETKAQYDLVIVVNDNAPINPLQTKTRLLIQVANTDEFPTTFNFTGSSNVTSVPEDFPLGGVVLQVWANDLDNDAIIYSFVSADTSTFQIDSIDGKIYLIKSLDRETADTYTVIIVAKNSLGSSSTANIEIQVTDVNDNDPQFSSSVQTVSLLETETIGYSVLNLTCSDSDIGDNGHLIFSIIAGNADGRFKLIWNEIVTDGSFDSDIVSHYSLEIQASDKGNPVRSAVTLVSVDILPVVTPPKFLPISDTIAVLENTVPGTLIYNLEATALGAKEYSNGTLRYIISSGNDDNLFTIIENAGEIILAGDLDADGAFTTYALVIESFSLLDPTLVDYFSLNITMLDVNDNPPLFSKAQYVGVVADGSDVGTPVMNLTATDIDSGSNGQIIFSLSGEGSADFVLDPSSGQLTAAKTIDHSVRGRYILTAQVVDGGLPALSSTAVIILIVELTQNNAPVFSSVSYTTSILENTASGTPVYKVAAVDTDTGLNGVLKYTLRNGNVNDSFSLTTDGVLSVADTLDRENLDIYDLEIECSDSGSPSLSATAILTISLLDLNDNPPGFTQNAYSFAVNKDAKSGYTLGSVSAGDADLGYNAEVRYAIISGNDAAMFILDPTSGILQTNSDLSVAVGTYTLVVRARDLGQIPLSKTVVVSIVVSDSPNYTFNILENQSNSIVGTVSKPGSFFYGIVSGDTLNQFEIDSSSGEIKTILPLDREAIPQYSLTIYVQDTLNPNSWYHVLVTVNVDDANDNDPMFSYASYSVQVMEGSQENFKVFDLPVIDDDEGANSDLLFEILDVESNAVFKINPTTKQLLIKEPPVFADKAFYDVRIRATDSGTIPRSAETTVRVEIIETALGTTLLGGGSVYLSLECSHSDKSGTLLGTLTPLMFGFSEANITSSEYITLQTERSPFTVGETSGQIKISNSDLVYADSKYIFWVVANVLYDDGSSGSRQGLVRVDTFDPPKNVIRIDLDIPYEDLAANGEPDALLAELNGQIANGRVSVWKVTDQTSSVTGRRKLLATGTSTVYVYGLHSLATDLLTGLSSTKQFMTSNELLGLFQASSDGAPSLPLQGIPSSVVSVLGVPAEPVTAEQSWAETTNGIAIIAMICIFVVLLVAALVIYFVCTRYKKRNVAFPARNKKLDSEGDIADDTSMSKSVFRMSHSPPPPYQSRPATAVGKIKIIDGIAYDGSGIDPDTGAKYYFNTKTGQTYGLSGCSKDETVLANKGLAHQNNRYTNRRDTHQSGSVDSLASAEIHIGNDVTEDVTSEKTVRNTLPVGLRPRLSQTLIGSEVNHDSFGVPPGSPAYGRTAQAKM